jgi:hypothetical protein
MMPDEEHPAQIKDRRATAFQALCLGALVSRGMFEQLIQTSDEEGLVGRTRTRVHALNTWLSLEGLKLECSPHEAALLDKPDGTWAAAEIRQAIWATEALGVLAWALLAVRDMPPYETPFSFEVVIDRLPVYHSTDRFLQAARLRPADEIIGARDITELWQWRAQITHKQREGIPPPEGTTYEARIAHIAAGAHEYDAIPEPINGDFPVSGKAYADLSAVEWSRIAAITRERFRALNWLCGHSDDWDSTSTDVEG